jgi:hypothetical protein
MTYIVNQQKPLLMMGQFDNLHWENDMAHNYTCGPSMSNYVDLPTTPHQKVAPFTHAK